MAVFAAGVLILASSAQEETFSVTLAFEAMHCDECRAEIEAILKKIAGCRSVEVAGDSVKAAFDEKEAVPAFSRLPKDLKLKSASISIRGTVSFSGDKATLVAKGSGTTLALSNPAGPPKADRLGDLKKQLSGKNRFRVNGKLSGGTIVLEAFAPADWTDK